MLDARILEVSTQESDSYVKEIYNKILEHSKLKPNQRYLILSLGAAASHKTINIETLAQNKANFTVPDNKGY